LLAIDRALTGRFEVARPGIIGGVFAAGMIA
jgi:hypothetical protein